MGIENIIYSRWFCQRPGMCKTFNLTVKCTNIKCRQTYLNGNITIQLIISSTSFFSKVYMRFSTENMSSSRLIPLIFIWILVSSEILFAVLSLTIISFLAKWNFNSVCILIIHNEQSFRKTSYEKISVLVLYFCDTFPFEILFFINACFYLIDNAMLR